MLIDYCITWLLNQVICFNLLLACKNNMTNILQAEFFETFSLAPVISGLKCNEILSSNGGPALKCTVHAIVKNHSQVSCD